MIHGVCYSCQLILKVVEARLNGLYPPLVYNLLHAPCLKIDMRCFLRVCLAEARSDMIGELAHAMLLLWKSLVTIKRK